MGKGYGLKECLGILKKDKEWEELEKEIKRAWTNWNKNMFKNNGKLAKQEELSKFKDPS